MAGPGIDLTIENPPLPPLPVYLSQVEPDLAVKPLPDSGGYVIPLTKWITNSRPPWNLQSRPIREKLQVNAAVPVLFSGHAKDRLLHDLWAGKASDGCPWQRIAAAGFDAAIGPDFSVWCDAPRIEHIVETKRSLIAAQRISQAGTPVIPNVFLHNEADAEGLGAWLHRQPTVTAVATNVQCFAEGDREREEYRSAAALFQRLREAAGRDIALVVIGLAQPKHLARLRETGFDITVVNGRAYQEAFRGQRLVFHPSGHLKPEQADSKGTELLRENQEFLTRLYSRVVRG